MKPQLLGFFAAAALLSAGSAYAAECEMRQDTDDFFSGVPTIRTERKYLNGKGCPSQCDAMGIFTMVSERGIHYLDFAIIDSERSVFIFVPTEEQLDNVLVVPVTATLEFTLADGNLIELPMLEVVSTKTEIIYPYQEGNENYIIDAGAGLKFALDVSAVGALGAQKVSSVRVLGANQSLNIPLDKKSQSYFKDAATCLIGETS